MKSMDQSLERLPLLCSICPTSQPIVYDSVFSTPELSATTTVVETIPVSVYLDPQCSPVPFAQLCFSSVLPVYDCMDTVLHPLHYAYLECRPRLIPSSF